MIAGILRHVLLYELRCVIFAAGWSKGHGFFLIYMQIRVKDKSYPDLGNLGEWVWADVWWYTYAHGVECRGRPEIFRLSTQKYLSWRSRTSVTQLRVQPPVEILILKERDAQQKIFTMCRSLVIRTWVVYFWERAVVSPFFHRRCSSIEANSSNRSSLAIIFPGTGFRFSLLPPPLLN